MENTGGNLFQIASKKKNNKEKKEHFNVGFGLKLKHLMMILWDDNHSVLLFKKKNVTSHSKLLIFHSTPGSL